MEGCDAAGRLHGGDVRSGYGRMALRQRICVDDEVVSVGEYRVVST